ncbi:Phosphate-binding protein PstS precursor [Planctomycetes bacterium Pan216]|uniref:Phosphate-binding protein n=1 Tax=Kolteria novifilia TaxID=2527975 RepID=A0A518B3M3_9BACT|nr:Phosphate-binding protein PstS precursor [Planctomycetes bacterium Pan216]
MRFSNRLVILATVALLLLWHGDSRAQSVLTFQGSGATFPYPLYQRWFIEFNKLNPQIRVNYSPEGSGQGINAFLDHMVDVGMSDAPLTDGQIERVKRGVQAVPMTAGNIVVTYNLPGSPPNLRLSREAVVAIFLRKATKWNDPVIQRQNRDVRLPEQPITVVRRASGSGTTYAFTRHLSAISKPWNDGPGFGKTVVWPTGTIGARGNQGVTALVETTPGAVGYVEYGFARGAGLPMARLENKRGRYIAPTEKSGQEALLGVTLPPEMNLWLPDPDREEAYPIVAYSWWFCYKEYKDPDKAEALRELIKYGLTEGQNFAPELGYLPLPEKLAKKILSVSLKHIR